MIYLMRLSNKNYLESFLSKKKDGSIILVIFHSLSTGYSEIYQIMRMSKDKSNQS